jgi:hypothetical protein
VSDGPTSKGFNPHAPDRRRADAQRHDADLRALGRASCSASRNNAQALGNVYAVEFTVEAITGVLNIAVVTDYFSEFTPPQYQLTSTMYCRSDGSWLVSYGNAGPTQGYTYQDYTQPGIPAGPLWQVGDKVALVVQLNGGSIAYFHNGVMFAHGPAQYYTGPPWLFMADAANGRMSVVTDLTKMRYGANYAYPGAFGGPAEQAQSWPTP